MRLKFLIMTIRTGDHSNLGRQHCLVQCLYRVPQHPARQQLRGGLPKAGPTGFFAVATGSTTPTAC